MNKLSATDLMPLEQYARERPAFRARVLQHKAERQLAVGPNATWAFEDRLTVQYQVQEMLRAERIFEPAGIAEELAAPMIASLHSGAALGIGTDHEHYRHALTPVPAAVQRSLVGDLQRGNPPRDATP